MASRRHPDNNAPREPWQYTLAAVFTAAAVSDLVQIVQWLLDHESARGALALWHAVTLATSVACLVSVWGRRLWAPYAVAAWGVANTTLVLAVPFLVSVPKEGVQAIWAGAGVVGVLAAVCVWVVWRRVQSQQ